MRRKKKNNQIIGRREERCCSVAAQCVSGSVSAENGRVGLHSAGVAVPSLRSKTSGDCFYLCERRKAGERKASVRANGEAQR